MKSIAAIGVLHGLRAFGKRRSVRILGGMVLIVLVFLAVLPFGIKVFLQRWLIKNGADSAVIERVRFSPFSGIAALEGVHVQMGGKTVFADTTVFVDIAMRNLLKKKAILEDVILSDVILDVERDKEGTLRVASYTVRQKGEGEKKKGDVETGDGVATAASKWIFFAQKIHMENITLHYHMPGVESNLLIQDALVEKFNTDPQSFTGSLKLQGTLNGAAVQLDIPKLRVVPYIDIQGKILLKGFHLQDLAVPLAGVLQPFSGTVTLDGSLAYTMKSADTFHVQWDGGIDLDQGAIGGKNWGVDGSLSWQGKAQYDMQPAFMQVATDGDLLLQNGRFRMPQPLIDIKSSEIALSGKTDVHIADSVQVTTSGTLKLAKTNYGAARFQTGADGVSWQGAVSVDTGTAKRKLSLAVNGGLTAEKPFFTLAQKQGTMQVGNDLLSWQGEVAYELEKGEERGQNVHTDGVLDGHGGIFALPGVLTIHPSDIKVAGTTDVVLGKGISVAYDGDVALADMDMKLPGINLGEKQLAWAGSVGYTLANDTEDTESSQQISTQGKLQGQGIRATLPERLKLLQNTFALEGKSSVKIGKELGVRYDGGMTLQGTSVKLDAMQMEQDESVWHGGVTVSRADKDLAVGLDGKLDLDATHFVLEKPQIQVQQGHLELRPVCSLTFGKVPALKGSANLVSKDLQIDMDAMKFAALDALSVTGLQDDGAGGVTVDAVHLDSLSLPASQKMPVDVAVQSVALQGLHSSDWQSGTMQRLEVTQPLIRQKKEKDMVLASLQSAVATHISLAHDLSARVRHLTFNEGSFLQNEGMPPQATLKKMDVKTLLYSVKQGFSCDTVVLDSLRGQFTRNKKVQTEQTAETSRQSLPQNDTAKDKKSFSFPLKINAIDVAGESSIAFTDKTLSQPFTTVFDLESLTVRDMDLNRPDVPFSYSLKGNFEKYTQLTMQGKAAPFAQDMLISQKASLKKYSMLHGSPYAIDAIGSYFPSGMCDVNSTLDIGKGRIDMKNNLIFTDLQVEKVKGKMAKSVNTPLPVPLGMAIKMLEDKNGLIDLDVPIKGKLSDIKIGMGDLIWTPLSNAITKAVTPYLAYTVLGPAGALTYLGVRVGSTLLQTDFPVLKFKKGQKELTEAHEKILNRVGTMMKKQLADAKKKEKEVSWSICAKVSLHELAGETSGRNQDILQNDKIRKELYALGEARSLVVREYLMEHFDIGKEHLSLCNPGLEFDESANPEVKFMQ